MSSELILALGTLAGAVAAAFATVFTAIFVAVRERSAAVLRTQEQIAADRRQITDDVRAELAAAREEIAKLRAERDAGQTGQRDIPPAWRRGDAR